MFPDRTFGNLMDLDQRLARHRQDLGGVRHLNRVEPPDPQPGRPLCLTVTTSGPVAFAAVQAWYRTEPGAPAAEHAVALLPEGAAWDSVEWGYVRRWTGALPPQPAGTMVRYRVAGRAANGRWIYADSQAETPEAATEFALWVDEGGVPEWAQAAVVYHIFIDRFNPGAGRAWRQPQSLAGFFGGTLRGVIEQLDYIHDLGFNTLWLSPLFASPSHHGYDATDYYTVEPRLGSNADLRELIDEAHARGLRVLLDFVANHWSHLHPTFQSARSDPNSPYRNWYTWNHWPDDYATYFGVKELPQLNLRPGPARDYLLEAARYWLAQGVDGYRLDYAYGPSFDFWADFGRACRTARPDCWLFGEVIHTAPVQLAFAGRLDGTLDFLLCHALRETFAHGTWDLARFDAFLAGHEAFFPPAGAYSRPAFLDNHDMNRFLFIAQEDRACARLAALVLFTLAGPPIVYYGSETGVTQARPIHQNDFGIFEEARLPMKWPGRDADADLDLHAFYRQLVRLRRAHRVLHSGTRRTLHLDNAAGTYAYAREGAAGRVLVALNLGDQPARLRLELPGFDSAARDQLNGHDVALQGDAVEVALGAKSGALVASGK